VRSASAQIRPKTNARVNGKVAPRAGIPTRQFLIAEIDPNSIVRLCAAAPEAALDRVKRFKIFALTVCVNSRTDAAGKGDSARTSEGRAVVLPQMPQSGLRFVMQVCR
jgi:hypothetical protein